MLLNTKPRFEYFKSALGPGTHKGVFGSMKQHNGQVGWKSFQKKKSIHKFSFVLILRFHTLMRAHVHTHTRTGYREEVNLKITWSDTRVVRLVQVKTMVVDFRKGKKKKRNSFRTNVIFLLTIISGSVFVQR